MIKIAIVEDHRESAYRLESFLKKYQWEIKETIDVTCFSNGLNFIEDYSADFDIVFMDIEMPLMNGMEAAKKLRKMDSRVDLIFLTVMSQYAVFGYDVNASAFLVKPVDETVLRVKLKKIIERRRRDNDRFIIFEKNSEHARVFYRDILYVESMNHYCFFHTKNAAYRKLVPLREVEKSFRENEFIRCNNSFLVNVAYVTNWSKDSVILDGSITLPISRAKRKSFLDELTKQFGGRC